MKVETSQPAPKRAAGGARPGAGRKKGGHNRSTLERMAAADAAMDRVIAKLGPDELRDLDPLAVLRICMHGLLQSKNLSGAASVAAQLAVYTHAKIGTALPGAVPLPEDLLPDPVPVPDSEDVPPVSEWVAG